MRNSSESYMVLIYEVATQQYSYVLVESNKALSKMLGAISGEQWIIASITPLANLEPYKDIYKRIIGSTKPDNLEFGKGL